MKITRPNQPITTKQEITIPYTATKENRKTREAEAKIEIREKERGEKTVNIELRIDRYRRTMQEDHEPSCMEIQNALREFGRELEEQEQRGELLPF